MNTRILIIAAMLLLGGSAQGFGQTKMIAHRSHGGSAESFRADGEDNFGMMPRHIDSVLRLTDTSAIEFSNYGQDTVRRHDFWNNPKISLDSLHRRFPRIKFIGFEQAQAGRARRSRRRADAIGIPADPARPGAGGLLLAIGAAIVPLVAYSIWRGDRGVKA